MKENKSRRSVKAVNRSSRKPGVKRRQADPRKSVSGCIKTSVSRAKAKSSVKPIKQAASKPARSLAHSPAGTGKASATVRPKAMSPQQQELERGRQWKQLHEQGLSFAQIAKKFKCSKSLVRDLVDLASLPHDLEEEYLAGRLGRKKAINLARALRKGKESTSASLTEKPQMEPKQRPEPVMTRAERQAKVTELATIIVEWFRSLGLAPYDQEPFWQQVNLGLYGGLPRLFTDEVPKPHEIRSNRDPWKVIKRCKVEARNPHLMTDVINAHVSWLARWIQRVIPDRAMMEDVIDQARRRLLREAREARWY